MAPRKRRLARGHYPGRNPTIEVNSASPPTGSSRALGVFPWTIRSLNCCPHPDAQIVPGICHENSTNCDTIGPERNSPHSWGRVIIMKNVKLAIATLLTVIATSGAIAAAPSDAGVVSANEVHCC